MFYNHLYQFITGDKMELREGMLGVVVVALALTCALFASYLAGIESEEHEVTKYQYLADVSGMFTYDKSPTYIEFDPSSNYVGYYSDSTGEYFPVNDIGYVKNENPITHESRVNNYRINLEPTFDIERQIDLTSELVNPDYETGTYRLYYMISETSNDEKAWTPSATNLIRLTDLLDAMQIDTTQYNAINITVGNVDWDGTPDGYGLDLDTVLFVPESWMFDVQNVKFAYVVNPNLDIAKVSEYHNPNNTPYFKYPIQSLSVDMNSGITTIYSEPDYTKQISTISTDTIMVFFGVHNVGQNFLDLSDYMNYQLYSKPAPEYLDPNYGVTMLDSGE